MVVIGGTGFDGGSASVLFGGTECVVTAQTNTSITCITRYAAPGIVGVSVEIVGAGVAEQDFSYEYILAVTSVTPTTGGLAGAARLTMGGEGFIAGSGSEATVRVVFEVPGLEMHVVGLYTVPPGTPSGQWRLNVTGNATEWISTDADADTVRSALVEAAPSLLNVDVFVVDDVPGPLLNRIYPRQWALRFSRTAVPGLGVERCTDPR